MRSTGIPRAIPISPVFQGSGYRTLRARREWARSPIDHASASEALTSASFKARRLLMRLARHLESDGSVPISASDPSVMRIRPVGTMLPQDDSWADATLKLMEAHGEYDYTIPAS